MTHRSTLGAALLGLSLTLGTFVSPAQAERLTIVNRNSESSLKVAINRAVVVESDIAFAELSIANPQIADISSLSDRSIYVLGKQPGITTLTLLDAEGRLITNVDVVVTADISEFKQRLRQILPDEKIEVRTANDGIVLSGVASSSQKLQRALDLAERYAPERVSNLMSVGGVQQVMLKVRFAEMQRSVSKSLSASLAANGTVLNGNPMSTGTGQYSNSGNQANGLARNIPATNSNAGATVLGVNAGAVQVSVLLEALETKGVVRTLAEPNLTALSGQEAKFLAGGEYPVPVAQDNGAITVEFKPFGVELNFIPRVVDDDIINLELKAAVSAIDSSNGFQANANFRIDAFSRRETSTTVEMRDGDSFAIAGLLQDEFRDNNSQVPWLGDIPILGALFRSADYQRDQSELVIIITAHLVSPTRGEALALPTDRIKPPSEKELFLFGKTAKEGSKLKGAAREVAKQDFTGSYGYVME